MQPARSSRIADGFANVHGERDDVVFYAGFQIVDARGVDFGASANRGGGFLGNFARFGQGFRGGQLDFEPFRVFIGVAPDAAHFFARIAWNQANPLSWQTMIAHLDIETVGGRQSTAKDVAALHGWGEAAYEQRHDGKTAVSKPD